MPKWRRWNFYVAMAIWPPMLIWTAATGNYLYVAYLITLPAIFLLFLLKWLKENPDPLEPHGPISN